MLLAKSLELRVDLWVAAAGINPDRPFWRVEMSPMYRVHLIPRWAWILIGIVGVLVIWVLFSQVMSRGYTSIYALGPEVETGNPADYVQQPSPGVEITPAPAPAPPIMPPQFGGTPPSGTTAGLPQSIQFDGQTYSLVGGPVQADVITTGQYAGNYIIYARINDAQPYKNLYLEAVPNSGKFYRYTITGAGT